MLSLQVVRQTHNHLLLKEPLQQVLRTKKPKRGSKKSISHQHNQKQLRERRRRCLQELMVQHQPSSKGVSV